MWTYPLIYFNTVTYNLIKKERVTKRKSVRPKILAREKEMKNYENNNIEQNILRSCLSYTYVKASVSASFHSLSFASIQGTKQASLSGWCMIYTNHSSNICVIFSTTNYVKLHLKEIAFAWITTNISYLSDRWSLLSVFSILSVVDFKSI